MFSTFEVSQVLNPSLSFEKDHTESLFFARKKGGYDNELYRAYYIVAMFIRGQYHYGNLKLDRSEERRILKFMRNEEDSSLLVEYLLPNNPKLYPC